MKQITFEHLQWVRITCHTTLTYVLHSNKAGTVHAVGKKSHCNISITATNAYGVHAKLNAAIMMITIPVNLFCLFATIFAIFPVDLIACYNIIAYCHVCLAIAIGSNAMSNGF